MDIRYTVVTSPVGKLLVAATEKGLCALLPASGFSELKMRFSTATLWKDDEGLQSLVSDVLDVFVHQRKKKISYDLRGTEFQKQVWAALEKIPLGKVVTYSKVAEMIGKPKAVRAAASACGANPIAILIPCHRVIGANGKLTGYHWGLEMKRKLLDREGVVTG